MRCVSGFFPSCFSLWIRMSGSGIHWMEDKWLFFLNHQFLPVLFKSSPSGVTLCFQLVSAAARFASAATMTFGSHVKTFELNPRYLGHRKSGKMYWMIVRIDKVRITHPIATKLDCHIYLVMFITWLDFEYIMVENHFLPNFLWFFKVKFQNRSNSWFV